MGRSPCCAEIGLKKGPWTPEEDRKLVDCVAAHGGPGNWKSLPKLAGLNRCGKSCRLRWINYLRPDIKRGNFSEEEEAVIINLHSSLGNKWSKIATYLPGRTDNEIKNFWNTHLRKKFLKMGIDPVTHRPRADLSFLGNCDISVLIRLLQAEETQLAQAQFLQNILQANSTISNQDSTGLDQYKGLIGNYGSNNKLNSYLWVQETSTMNCADPLRSLLGLSSPIFIVPKPAAEEQVSNNNLSDEFRGWYDILEEENPSLPTLFSVSDLETSQLVINEMGSTNVDKTSFSEVFESCNNWEKLMDDGNSGSFWEGL